MLDVQNCVDHQFEKSGYWTERNVDAHFEFPNAGRREDQLVAAALQIPERLMEVRQLAVPAPLEGELAAAYLATLCELEQRDGVRHWLTPTCGAQNRVRPGPYPQ